MMQLSLHQANQQVTSKDVNTETDIPGTIPGQKSLKKYFE